MEGKPFDIIMIEDNVDHAEMVIRALRAHRVSNRIVHLPDGEAALDYLFGGESTDDTIPSTTPHLILLDLRLPKIDGLEVLQKVRSAREYDSVPVVILTTSANDNDIALAYRYKANSYLVKPVDFKKFRDLLDDLGFYWLTWNRRVIEPGETVRWPPEHNLP